MPRAPHLLIAIPCRNEIRSSVFLDLVVCIAQAGAYWYRVHGDDARVSFYIQPRAHVVAARNAAVAQALSSDVDWVLWLDDDMQPPPDLLESLHATGREFVGAVAYRREPPYLPCVGRVERDTVVHFDPDPSGGLVRADVTGFACVLTHRRVLEVVSARTAGRPFAWRGDDGIGEDYYFCLQARAAGIELAIVPDVVVGHATDVVIDRSHRQAFLTASAAPSPSTPNSAESRWPSSPSSPSAP